MSNQRHEPHCVLISNCQIWVRLFTCLWHCLVVLFRNVSLCCLPLVPLQTHTLTVATQHTTTTKAFGCHCVYMYCIMCRRPDGVNNGKITVHDIRARIFILEKNCTIIHTVQTRMKRFVLLHQNNTHIRTLAVPHTHTHTIFVDGIEYNTHTTYNRQSSSNVRFLWLFFYRIRLAIMDFQFQYTASCWFHPKRYIRFKRLVLCVVRNRTTPRYTKK